MVVMNNGQSIGILNQQQQQQPGNKDQQPQQHLQQLQLQQIQVAQKAQQQYAATHGLRPPFPQQIQFQSNIQTQQQQQQAVQNHLMQQQAMAQHQHAQNQQQQQQQQQAAAAAAQGQQIIINGQGGQVGTQLLALSSGGGTVTSGTANIQPKSAMIITTASQGGQQQPPGGGPGDRPIMTISNAAVQIVNAAGQPLTNPLTSPQGPLQPQPNPLLAMTSLAALQSTTQLMTSREMTVTAVSSTSTPIGSVANSTTTTAVSSSGATPTVTVSSAVTETGKTTTTTTTTTTDSKSKDATGESQKAASIASTATTTTTTTATTLQSSAETAVTGVTNGNISGSTKMLLEKGGLPKAMVKPQVLTHVIEGFVIQEANEPFPVTRQRYPVPTENGADEDEPPKKKMAVQAVNGEAGADAVAALGPDQLACEVCGKVELKAKMKKKRYCSVTCSKSAKEKGSGGGGGVAVAAGIQDEKNGKGEEKAMSDDMKMDTSCDSATGSTTTTVPVADEESCDILKWTVQEVCDFIKDLPGCADYVEDFETQEIDGQALLLLKENHLVNAMGMKLGPALKIVAKVEAIRAGSASGAAAAAGQANVSGSANDSTASITMN